MLPRAIAEFVMTRFNTRPGGRWDGVAIAVIAMLVGGGAVGPAWAQHDPQRNATRLIATGDYTAAWKELGKGEPGEPETHFVAMSATKAVTSESYMQNERP